MKSLTNTKALYCTLLILLFLPNAHAGWGIEDFDFTCKNSGLSKTLKSMDISNKNSSASKNLFELGCGLSGLFNDVSQVDWWCMGELMLSGKFGAACLYCATSATAATTFNPLLGVGYSACVPFCASAAGFSLAAANQCNF